MIIILITENEDLLNEKTLQFNKITFVNVNIDGFKNIMSNNNINEFLVNTLFITDNIP
jgi:hypothetical protein